MGLMKTSTILKGCFYAIIRLNRQVKNNYHKLKHIFGGREKRQRKPRIGDVTPSFICGFPDYQHFITLAGACMHALIHHVFLQIL